MATSTLNGGSTLEGFASIRDSTGTTFYLDCSLSENHEFESEVTQYPVESGSSIVDNIRPKPIKVTMEALVSNTPIGLITKLRGDTNTEPVSDAYQFLMRLRDKRLPVRITTSLDTYDSMAMENLAIARARGRGDELHFTATFLQIATVSNKRTTIQTATPSGRGPTKTSKPLDKNYNLYTVCPKAHYWYDANINAWRLYAQLQPSHSQATIDGKSVPLDGKYSLSKHTPYVTDDEWARYFVPRNFGAEAADSNQLLYQATKLSVSKFGLTALWNQLPETGVPSKQDLEQWLSQTRPQSQKSEIPPAVATVLQAGGPSALLYLNASQAVVLSRT